MRNRVPLIVILGATGCGKTKLSLELAEKFGGEIIGADSMQVYKGLDIITAKATPEEQSLHPHHLIDVIQPHQLFNVVDFRNKALPIVNNLLETNKLPIVVGGTNYYIESLLWKILIEDPQNKEPILLEQQTCNSSLPSKELHKQLQECDPDMAKRLHPNNRRKILRSLEVLQQKGRKLSDILTEQQSSEGGSLLGGGLRYENALIFWLQCEQAILDQRLNSRVDSMIEQGLLDELLQFHKDYNENRLKNCESPDYTKGIFQSIGFKEFHDYLILNDNERISENGRILFRKGVDDLKLVTRRYARKQKRWITNRFLSISNREVPPVFGLDTSDVSHWDQNVKLPAVDIVQNYMEGTVSRFGPLPKRRTNLNPNAKDDTFVCETCERVFVGQFQWESHLKSNKHKRALNKKSRVDR